MRDTFIRSLTEMSQADPNIILITGDLGFGVLTDFAKNYPEQFINAGVAEQNMTGIAAGLALEGKTVFTYSIGNFPTLRSLEQVRNDICYHNANVKIVCIGGGFAYGPLGMSHHATEDLAILRALPNLDVVAPGDTVETALATRALCQKTGPAYLRLGRGGEPKVHDNEFEFKVGTAVTVRSGDGDVALISTGGILDNVVQARELLVEQGVIASVTSLHTLAPLDVDSITTLAQNARLIVTIEEHSRFGGLGGAVAEVLADHSLSGSPARLLRIGLERQYASKVGSTDYLRDAYGLSPEKIAATIRKSLNM